MYSKRAHQKNNTTSCPLPESIKRRWYAIELTLFKSRDWFLEGVSLNRLLRRSFHEDSLNATTVRIEFIKENYFIVRLGWFTSIRDSHSIHIRALWQGFFLQFMFFVIGFRARIFQTYSPIVSQRWWHIFEYHHPRQWVRYFLFHSDFFYNLKKWLLAIGIASSLTAKCIVYRYMMYGMH